VAINYRTQVCQCIYIYICPAHVLHLSCIPEKRAYIKNDIPVRNKGLE
jgi:hypothetical protein